MINVIAPPGCYGTYISRCLHHYTLPDSAYQFDFDIHGSSHAFRNITSNIKKTSLIHHQGPDSVKDLDPKTTIIVTAHPDYNLDYFDNQFYKQSKGNLIEYMLSFFSIAKIQEDLEKNWSYTTPFDITAPNWIIREYCSFWLTDAWKHGYSINRYLSLPHSYSFCCEDLWHTSIWDLLSNLSAHLDTEIHAPESIVEENHQDFLKCQPYHGIQMKCEQFVDDSIKQKDTISPCVSIFDEAYVQHILRKQGYEIQCQGLDQFPQTSRDLANIIHFA